MAGRVYTRRIIAAAARGPSSMYRARARVCAVHGAFDARWLSSEVDSDCCSRAAGWGIFRCAGDVFIFFFFFEGAKWSFGVLVMDKLPIFVSR